MTVENISTSFLPITNARILSEKNEIQYAEITEESNRSIRKFQTLGTGFKYTALVLIIAGIAASSFIGIEVSLPMGLVSGGSFAGGVLISGCIVYIYSKKCSEEEVSANVQILRDTAAIYNGIANFFETQFKYRERYIKNNINSNIDNSEQDHVVPNSLEQTLKAYDVIRLGSLAEYVNYKNCLLYVWAHCISHIPSIFDNTRNNDEIMGAWRNCVRAASAFTAVQAVRRLGDSTETGIEYQNALNIKITKAHESGQLHLIVTPK